MSAAPAPRRNPYVGPRALRYGESIYGRDRESRQLLELLIAERIVLLYSPSGAGKTSLIQAALRPELEGEDFNVLPVIRVSRGVAAGTPCNPYILSALLSLEEGIDAEHATSPEALAQMSFAEYLGQREAARADGRATFLIFDQFEEILTFDPLNRDAKMDFFSQVGAALRDMRRWALFAMREDHVGALDPYLRPVPTRLKATFRLDLLNAEGARKAVQQPAREQGVDFTESATTKLVDDLRQVSVQGATGAPETRLGLYVEPVQLQVVCYRVWEKLDASTKEITDSDVTGAGDVDSALADYYAERVAQIALKTGLQERHIREWFDRELITESGIRGQVMQGDESSQGLSNAAIDQLENVHLVRCEQRRGVKWVELSHDRLVKPIRADNSAWFTRHLSVLQHQAAVWNYSGKPDALCLRAEALDEAQHWAAAHASEMTDEEREFLEACERNRDARQSRRLRLAVVAMSAVMLCISVFAGLAAWQWSRARKESRIAEEQRRVAEVQQQIAEDQRSEAETARTIATARSLAAQSMQIRDRLDTALLLATEAQMMADRPETVGALLSAVYANPRLRRYLHGTPSPPGALAFNADGTLLATGDFEGKLTFWDMRTGRPVRKAEQFVNDALRVLAFSTDGRFLAASSKSAEVKVRDLQTGKVRELPQEFAHRGDVWALAFSPDSKLLVSGSTDDKIVLWEVGTEKVQELRDLGSDVRSIAFHPDGSQFTAGCSNGEILAWKRDGAAWVRDPRRFAIAHDGEKVFSIAISPDGRHLAAARTSARRERKDDSAPKEKQPAHVDLYDFALAADPVPIVASGTHAASAIAVTFCIDVAGRTRLVSASFDGTLRLWDVPSMQQSEPPLTGHVGRIHSLAFSPLNQTVASGGGDRTTILWDPWLHVAQPTRGVVTDLDFAVAVSPDASIVANAERNGRVTLQREPEQGMVYHVIEVAPASNTEPPPDTPAPIVTFSAENRVIAIAGADGKVRVHQLGAAVNSKAEQIAEIDATGSAPGARISALGLSKDGALVAAAVMQKGEPARGWVWRVANREPVFDAPLRTKNDDSFYAIEFSPDGKRLVTGGDGERAFIWNLDDRSAARPMECPEEHTSSIRSIAFSSDSRNFATTSGDNTLILWDANTGRHLGPPLTGHQAPVVAAAFSPDGRLLASGSEDTSIILWDVASKQRMARLTHHTATVRGLAFSKDSKRLYSTSWGGDVWAWKFEPDNFQSISWTKDSRVWELDPETLRKMCGARANRNFTENEWAVYMQDAPYRETWPQLPAPGEEFAPAPSSAK
jgi:WD40 repeat protein